MRGIFTKGLLAALCLGIAAPSANAYTVDEIIANGEWMKVQYRYSTFFDSSWDMTYGPTLTEVIQLEKVDDQHIKFKGIRGSLDFIFDLVDYNGDLTDDGVCLQIPGNRQSTSDSSADNKAWYIIPILKTSTPKTHPEKHWELRIYKNSDNSLYFQEDYAKNDSWGAVMLPTGSAASTSHSFIIDWARFEPYTGYNAMCTDSYSNYIGTGMNLQLAQTVNRQYPVTLNLDFDNKTFSIKNFSKLYAATTLNGTYTAIDGNPTYGTEADITGTLTDDNRLLFDFAQIARLRILTTKGYNPWWGISYEVHDWYTFNLSTKDYLTTGEQGQLEGRYYECEDGKPTHNNIEHGWVSNHGKRRTYDGFTVEIDPYAYVYVPGDGDPTNLQNDPNIYDSFENTVITDSDCTLDVDLNIETVEWDSEHKVGHVKASIVTNKNDQYVDHYDVMIVGGKYKFIDDKGFRIHSENGFENAQQVPESGIVKTETTVSRASEVGTHDYKIDHWFGKELGEHHNTNGEYTFFIRANYKPETSLTPTFHSLQYYESPIPTGIETVGTDIEKPGDNTIYDLFGRRVVNPQHGTLYIIGGKKVIY